MIIFNTDGTIKCVKGGRFGWLLRDVIVDESVQGFEEINSRIRERCDSCEDIWVEVVRPRVAEARVVGAVGTILPEGDIVTASIQEVLTSRDIKDAVNYSVALLRQQAADKVTSRTGNRGDKVEVISRDTVVECEGFGHDDDTRNALKRCCGNICEIHREVKKLRIEFQKQEERITKLISETIHLHRNILERNYLDEFIALLAEEPFTKPSALFPIANTNSNNLVI